MMPIIIVLRRAATSLQAGKMPISVYRQTWVRRRSFFSLTAVHKYSAKCEKAMAVVGIVQPDMAEQSIVAVVLNTVMWTVSLLRPIYIISAWCPTWQRKGLLQAVRRVTWTASWHIQPTRETQTFILTSNKLLLPTTITTHHNNLLHQVNYGDDIASVYSCNLQRS